MHTTVGDMITELKKLPLDARVVVSIDEEGNGYGDPITSKPEKGVDGGQVVVLYPINQLDEDTVFDFGEE